MKQAFFITGFNNWGKTRIIRELFNRHNFLTKHSYQIDESENNFTVVQYSNDDYVGNRWIKELEEFLNKNPAKNNHLVIALCASMEPNNDFTKLLRNKIFKNYSALNVLLLKRKWDNHAELITKNIIEYGNNIPNIKFYTIDADKLIESDAQRQLAKVKQIKKIINQSLS